MNQQKTVRLLTRGCPGGSSSQWPDRRG
jgi:hypothetical protein